MEDTEGNTYRTVQIGTQCWSAENMRSHCDNKGNPLFVGVSDEPSDYYFLPYFLNPSNNPRKYGYLYNWRAALEICPEGWHLPSKEEWEKLIDYVKSNSDYCCDGKTKTLPNLLHLTTGGMRLLESVRWGTTPLRTIQQDSMLFQQEHIRRIILLLDHKQFFGLQQKALQKQPFIMQ